MSIPRKNLNIYLFRHGETDWNRMHKIQGHIDTELNEKGREQAEGLAQKMQSLKLAALFSSDLKRAAKTAEIVNAKHALEIQHSPLLREAFMGEAQGKTRQEIIEIYGAETWDEFRCLDWTNLDASMPGGETRRAQINRFLTFFDEILSSEILDGSNVGIASHGGVLRNIIHHKFPDIEHAVPIHNCCCYKLEVIDGNFKSYSLFH